MCPKTSNILYYKVCLKSSVNPIRKQTKQNIQTNFLSALQNSCHLLQHKFVNLRTASGNNQERPPVESITEWLSYDLWWHSSLQNVHLWWPPSSGERGRSLQEPDLGSLWTQCHRLPFWFWIKLIARGLISRDNVFQKQWILVIHGNEVSRSFHLFCFLLIRSRTSIYPNNCGRWCAPCPCYCPIPPQSILASVTELVSAFVTLSRPFMGFCLSMTDPNVAHPQSFPSLHESVCKHIFCLRLHSVYLHQHITLLHCSFPNL